MEYIMIMIHEVSNTENKYNKIQSKKSGKKKKLTAKTNIGFWKPRKTNIPTNIWKLPPSTKLLSIVASRSRCLFRFDAFFF